MTAVRIVWAGPERIGDLEPLWKSLYGHHRSVDPMIPGVALRGEEESWSLRRAEYVQWLAEPDAFALIAEEEEGRAVGYALVHFREQDDSRVTGGRFGELESLAVLPEARGRGIGTALMAAVYRELRALGVGELEIGVLVTNDGARRFYEREGFRPWLVKYFGPLPEAREGES